VIYLKGLISIVSPEELPAAINGKADIIDLKNPEEGSLGAASPSLIKQVRISAPNHLISVAIGDVPNLPCMAALTALGAIMFDIDYIKVGLYGAHSYTDGLKLLNSVVSTIREYNSETQIVGAGYADAMNFGGVNPLKIPKIVKNSGADIAMLDTINKKNKNLFHFLDRHQLKIFINETHDFGLLAALAGSLRKDDIPILYSLGTDILGFRGAVCSNNDRKNGVISEVKVAEIMKYIKDLV